MKNSFLIKKNWGNINGKEIFLFELINQNGVKLGITNFGGIIQSLQIPTKEGYVETMLGFNTLEEYLGEEYRKNYPYFGAIIGRNAGRIKNGKTILNGKELQLTVNHNNAQLHGGFQGFDSKVWQVVGFENSENPWVSLRYVSADKEEGYPGEVIATVTYTLTEKNVLRVDYHGTTSESTILNLTQHAYFNFNRNSENILNHYLQVNADRVSLLNPDYSPTGELTLVEGTKLDFRTPALVNKDIDNAFPRQVSENEVVGSLFCKETNIKMQVKTSHPVLHIYGGFYVPELEPKDRKKTGQNAGICFECQGFADALNYPQFQSTQLNKDEVYSYFTEFEFSW